MLSEADPGMNPQTQVREISPVKPNIYTSYAKRSIDVALIVATAPITLLIVGIFAALIWLTGASPFYTQLRVGRDGKLFRMWKLRSMVMNAEQALEVHLANDEKAREEWELTQKLQNDPRITPLGRLLRKSSMDELPQLWNVFIGDMSIVGPRPMMPCQQELYPSEAYYRLRPGVTGYWQIAGRHRTAFSARAEFDEQYEKDLSLTTDMRVLVKTVGVVVLARGC